MRTITNLMYDEFGMKHLMYDFAGYTYSNKTQLSFHHLIIPRRECRKCHVPQEGYIRENGAILKQSTSHDYLHKIETVDRDVFLYITDQMIMENLSGKIELERLRKIRSALEYFEREHCSDRCSSGKRLIKREYLENRIKV